MLKSQVRAFLPIDIAKREILNLGCGRKHLPNAINLDLNPDVKPDVVHDLNCLPWPFPNEHFLEVVAYDVIEHLNDVVATMDEIHRVSRHGALIRITVPHFSCANAFTDLTHRHSFGWSSLHYFTGEEEYPIYIIKARFRRRSTQIVFLPTILNKMVWRLANRFPKRYERRWAWIFPAWFLSFELEVLKDTGPDAYEDARSP